MRKIYLLALLLLATTIVFAQAPEEMSYQAVIRDGDGDPVTTEVGMKISIRQGEIDGTVVYSETHTPTPNANGLVSLQIGTGDDVVGTFSTINWANGPYFIETGTDLGGGVDYTDVVGVTQLLSVPYALYAKTAASTPSGLPTGGTTNQVLTKINNTNYNTQWTTLSGIPAGGTTNQVLTKTDNTNYNAQWTTPSAGGGLSAYAYIYNLDAQVVALEADVTFSSNGVIAGLITHTPNTSTITLGTAGDYEVTFSVSGVEPNQFALFQNGTAVTGGIFGSGAGTQQNTGSVIITAASGDVLTLRNHTSSAAVTLQTLAGGTQVNSNASIKIMLLSN